MIVILLKYQNLMICYGMKNFLMSLVIGLVMTTHILLKLT